MKNKKITIAIYTRISKKEEEKGESIENQRKIIYEYIDCNFKGINYETREYCDDGVSGKNMERDGFMKMTDMCRKGEIDVIIIKDMSRLGRNYIRCGEYAERIFPQMNVRLIAVNDGYDGDGEDCNIKIKNILNDMYRRDISEKIKKSIKLKKKRGEYIKKFYGYQKEKGKLVIDKNEKIVIERIFKNAAKGMRTAETARLLNDEKIMAPSGKIGGWCIENIRKILNDERYIGDMVSREIFFAVKRRGKKKSKTKSGKGILMKCGECGYCIRRGKCSRAEFNGNRKCGEVAFGKEELKKLREGIEKNILLWAEDEEKEKNRMTGLQRKIKKEKERKMIAAMNGDHIKEEEAEKKIKEYEKEKTNKSEEEADFDRLCGTVEIYAGGRVLFSLCIHTGVTM
ncbi:MAG: recombinase family protein [Firmicutes bacterium]|nr:recombinase family protein [Bacillota bacterium]